MDFQTGCEGVEWTKLVQDGVQIAEFCEHGREPSVSIEAGNFLANYHLSNKDPAPWSPLST
jgi:hypothetical protein